MQVDAAVQAAMRHQGLVPLSTAQGMQVFYQGLSTEHSHLVVLAGNPKRIKQLVEQSAQPALPSTPPILTASSNSTADTRGLTDKALHYFKQQLSSALKLGMDRLDVEAPLENYGMDSVMAMELTNHLETRFGPLSKTLFFEVQTLRALSDYFLAHHSDALHALLGTSATTAVSAPLSLTPETPSKKPTRRQRRSTFSARVELVHHVSTLLKMRLEDIDLDSELNEYGFDSISLTELSSQLTHRYSIPLTPTIFFEYPTLADFAQYLVNEYRDLLSPVLNVRASTAQITPPSNAAATLPTSTPAHAQRRRRAFTPTPAAFISGKPGPDACCHHRCQRLFSASAGSRYLLG